MSISSLIGAIVPTELNSLFSGEKEEKKVFLKSWCFCSNLLAEIFKKKRRSFEDFFLCAGVELLKTVVVV